MNRSLPPGFTEGGWPKNWKPRTIAGIPCIYRRLKSGQIVAVHLNNWNGTFTASALTASNRGTPAKFFATLHERSEQSALDWANRYAEENGGWAGVEPAPNLDNLPDPDRGG